MQSDPQLHHASKRIAQNSLEKVIEVFELFGCEVNYRPSEYRWAMVGQKDLNFDIQLFEVNDVPDQSKSKVHSHVAFISNDPAEKIAEVERWAAENNVRFEKGGWNEKELWFDLPDLFVDFVIEVMHTSVVAE